MKDYLERQALNDALLLVNRDLYNRIGHRSNKVGGGIDISHIGRLAKKIGVRHNFWGTVLLDEANGLHSAGYQQLGNIIINFFPNQRKITGVDEGARLVPFGSSIQSNSPHAVTFGAGLSLGFKTKEGRAGYLSYFEELRKMFVKHFETIKK